MGNEVKGLSYWQVWRAATKTLHECTWHIFQPSHPERVMQGLLYPGAPLEGWTFIEMIPVWWDL